MRGLRITFDLRSEAERQRDRATEDLVRRSAYEAGEQVGYARGLRDGRADAAVRVATDSPLVTPLTGGRGFVEAANVLIALNAPRVERW